MDARSRGARNGDGRRPARPSRATTARNRLAFALPRGWGDFLRQLAIWFGFAAAYQVARGLADPGATEAFANARRVIHAEERLGVLFELDLQRSVVETGGLLLHAVNWTYWLSQFTVVGLALLWIYLRRYPAYLRVRNTIIVANAIGLRAESARALTARVGLPHPWAGFR